MAEEFAEFMKRCNSGSIEEKLDNVIKSITKISNIFINTINLVDERITILEQYIKNSSNSTPKRSELPEIPSEVSEINQEYSVKKVKELPSIKKAIMNELKELFDKKRLKK